VTFLLGGRKEGEKVNCGIGESADSGGKLIGGKDSRKAVRRVDCCPGRGRGRDSKVEGKTSSETLREGRGEGWCWLTLVKREGRKGRVCTVREGRTGCRSRVTEKKPWP